MTRRALVVRSSSHRAIIMEGEPVADVGTKRRLGSAPGSYLLMLDLPRASDLRIGARGTLHFDAGVYLYAGSAFGPGGLAARIGHHRRPARRPHWHVDYLRATAPLIGIWISRDPRRLECAFFEAALRLRGAGAVLGFGASDCDCPSHLVALGRRPSRVSFRRHLGSLVEHPGRIEAIT